MAGRFNRNMRRHAKKPRASVSGRRLVFEPLEDRRVLSITVNTLVDENDGIAVGGISLRDAIAAVAPGDTINFAASLTASGPATITLTHGSLLIMKDLTISGPGSDQLTIDAAGNDATPDTNDGNGSRIFDIYDGISGSSIVSISGLTLTGGDVPDYGGAIENAEFLMLSDCVVVDNSAAVNGGGCFSDSNLLITNCNFYSNTAGSSGGAISYQTFQPDQSGNGGVGVSGCTFQNNTASFYGGAIDVKGQLSVTQSSFFSNTDSNGSAIYVAGDGIEAHGSSIAYSNFESNIDGPAVQSNFTWLQVTHSNFHNNTYGGVDFQSSNVTITDCAIQGSYLRSGVRSYYGNLTVENSVISGNSRSGIEFFDGNLSVSSSSITGNRSVYSGGGITATLAEVTITSSTIAGNYSKANGGGIFIARDSNLTVFNSTISGNSTDSSGGGLYLLGNGTTNFKVSYSTITANTVGISGAFGGGVFFAGGSLTLAGDIVAANLAPIAPDLGTLFGNTIQARYSLIGSNNGTPLAEAPANSPDANGNKIGGPVHGPIDPKLGPLAYNFGPKFLDDTYLQTHALLPGSPAIDAGDPNFPSGFIPLFDERGAYFSRRYDGDKDGVARIDIGAFEAQPKSLPGDYNSSSVVNAADYVLWRMTLASTTDLRADGNSNQSIDGGDYYVWRLRFGEASAVGGTNIPSSAEGALAQVSSPLNTSPQSSESKSPLSTTTDASPAVVSLSQIVPSITTSSVPTSVVLSEVANANSPNDLALLAWLESFQNQKPPSTFSADVSFCSSDSSAPDTTCGLSESLRLSAFA